MNAHLFVIRAKLRYKNGVGSQLLVLAILVPEWQLFVLLIVFRIEICRYKLMIDVKLVSDIMRLTVFFTLLQFVLVCIRHNLISRIVKLTILALDNIGYKVDSLEVSLRRIV